MTPMEMIIDPTWHHQPQLAPLFSIVTYLRAAPTLPHPRLLYNPLQPRLSPLPMRWDLQAHPIPLNLIQLSLRPWHRPHSPSVVDNAHSTPQPPIPVPPVMGNTSQRQHPPSGGTSALRRAKSARIKNTAKAAKKRALEDADVVDDESASGGHKPKKCR